MATNDRSPDDVQDPETGPPPELADWWVWGVRKIAAVVAGLLLAGRGIAVLFILLKAVTWAITRDRGELWGFAGAVAAFFGLWAGGLLLGRFSAERDSPDPERWLQRRRTK